MIPTFFVTVAVGGFAIYKIITLMVENDVLRAQNDKLTADNNALRGQLKSK